MAKHNRAYDKMIAVMRKELRALQARKRETLLAYQQEYCGNDMNGAKHHWATVIGYREQIIGIVWNMVELVMAGHAVDRDTAYEMVMYDVDSNTGELMRQLLKG